MSCADFIAPYNREDEGALADLARRTFDEADLLLVDDFQFVDGRTDLGHYLAALIGARFDHHGAGTLVATAKPPSELARLSAEVRSRIAAGTRIDVGDPSASVRKAVFQRVAESLDLAPQQSVRLSAELTPVTGDMRRVIGMARKAALLARVRTD